MIQVDLSGARGFIGDLEPYEKKARESMKALRDRQYAMSDFLDLPRDFSQGELDNLKSAAADISKDSAALVVIGIGGSYLGARSLIELVRSPFYNTLASAMPQVYFAGNNASGEYLEQIIAMLAGRDFSINIVSKSGSTTEPSVAFRVFKNLLEARYGKEAARRIYVTTDRDHGPLRAFADSAGCRSFVIPAGVGGRYSVLTAVGLLPAAVAGVDIDAVMAGAREESEDAEASVQYAAARGALYSIGKKVEILGCFEPAFRMVGEWWKQLFGESEGKEGRGIFPAFCDYTADLHSMGQYIQEGERILMETLVSFAAQRSRLRVPPLEGFDDGLAALSGREICEVNRAAFDATKRAHIDGGVPVIELKVPEIGASCFGALAYFFERSCAVSAAAMGVDPFTQPGVEAYKKNMKRILGL